MAMEKGKMDMCQLRINKLKATNKKGVSFAPGLTSHLMAQSAGAICV